MNDYTRKWQELCRRRHSSNQKFKYLFRLYIDRSIIGILIECVIRHRKRFKYILNIHRKKRLNNKVITTGSRTVYILGRTVYGSRSRTVVHIIVIEDTVIIT